MEIPPGMFAEAVDVLGHLAKAVLFSFTVALMLSLTITAIITAVDAVTAVFKGRGADRL